MEKKLKNVHHGHNIKCLRNMLGIKQDSIADEIDMSQQNYSILESKQNIDNETLEKIAEIMKIPVDAIKNFSEDAVINIISSNLHDHSGSVVYNSFEKVVELYDKLLAEKDKVIALMQQIIEKR